MFEPEPVVMESPLDLEACNEHITQRLDNHLATRWLWEPNLQVETSQVNEHEYHITLTLATIAGYGVNFGGRLQSSGNGTKVTGSWSTTLATKIVLLWIPGAFGVPIFVLGVALQDIQGACVATFVTGLVVYWYWYQRKYYGDMLLGGLRRTLRVK